MQSVATAFHRVDTRESGPVTSPATHCIRSNPKTPRLVSVHRCGEWQALDAMSRMASPWQGIVPTQL